LYNIRGALVYKRIEEEVAGGNEVLNLNELNCSFCCADVLPTETTRKIKTIKTARFILNEG
jgi:hypothetical protein